MNRARDKKNAIVVLTPGLQRPLRSQANAYPTPHHRLRANGRHLDATPADSTHAPKGVPGHPGGRIRGRRRQKRSIPPRSASCSERQGHRQQVAFRASSLAISLALSRAPGESKSHGGKQEKTPKHATRAYYRQTFLDAHDRTLKCMLTERRLAIHVRAHPVCVASHALPDFQAVRCVKILCQLRAYRLRPRRHRLVPLAVAEGVDSLPPAELVGSRATSFANNSYPTTVSPSASSLSMYFMSSVSCSVVWPYSYSQCCFANRFFEQSPLCCITCCLCSIWPDRPGSLNLAAELSRGGMQQQGRRKACKRRSTHWKRLSERGCERALLPRPATRRAHPPTLHAPGKKVATTGREPHTLAHATPRTVTRLCNKFAN